MKKIYKVTFNEYTNSSRDTISTRNDKKLRYLSVPDEYLLIEKDDYDFVQQFGDGIRSMEYVGELLGIKEQEF